MIYSFECDDNFETLEYLGWPKLITSVAIENHTTKYKYGEKVDTENTTVTILRKDGEKQTGTLKEWLLSNKTTSSNFITFSPEVFNTVGKNTSLTVAIGMGSDKKRATVNDIEVEDFAKFLNIKSLPTKTSYIEGDKFSLEGMKVEVVTASGEAFTIPYSTDSKSDWKKKIVTSITKDTVLSLGTSIVGISYTGSKLDTVGTTFHISVEPVEIVSLECTTTLPKLPVGSCLDENVIKEMGLEFSVTYNNGEEGTITGDGVTDIISWKLPEGQLKEGSLMVIAYTAKAQCILYFDVVDTIEEDVVEEDVVEDDVEDATDIVEDVVEDKKSIKKKAKI